MTEKVYNVPAEWSSRAYVDDKAYLLDLLADMVEAGESLHTSPTHGGYMEIDTLEDESLAAEWWAGRG